MGWLEDAWNDLVGVVEDVAEAVVDVVEDVVEAVVDVVEDVAEVVVDVAEDVADWTLNVLDDTVFDTVDFLTGGVIDVDYDDGQFSAGLDIGIASVGVSFGEQGFSAESSFDVGLASGEISYDTDDGFAMSGSIGAEWLPLPYAEGHMSFEPNGEISIGGVIQGTLPLPFGGEVGGELSGGFERNADGSWGATADLEFDASSRLTGDISIDAGGSVGVDSDGNFYGEGDKDVFIDRDRDGVNDRDEQEEFDDLVGGGIFGGKGGQVDAGDLERQADPSTGGTKDVDGDGDIDSEDEIMSNLGKAAEANQSMQDATNLQGLESATTRPDDGVADDGADEFGPDVTLDFVSPPPVGPNGPPTMDIPPIEEFVPVEQFVPLDPLAIPVDAVMAEPAIPQPLPEPPPPSDFAVEIEAIDNVEVAADEMWDDLG